MGNQPHNMPQRNLWVSGIVLMVLGALWLFAQVFDLQLGAIFWPWFVIVPGILLLVWGLSLQSGSGLGLSIAGSIVTVVGLVLFYQQLFDQFQSWAYAWALVAPGGVGLGHVLYGVFHNDQALVRTGSRILGIAAAIFVGGLIFFEVIIGISGYGLGFWAWPLLRIVAGMAVVGLGLWRNSRPEGPPQ